MTILSVLEEYWTHILALFLILDRILDVVRRNVKAGHRAIIGVSLSALDTNELEVRQEDIPIALSLREAMNLAQFTCVILVDPLIWECLFIDYFVKSKGERVRKPFVKNLTTNGNRELLVLMRNLQISTKFTPNA